MSITPTSRAAEALDALVRPAPRRRLFLRAAPERFTSAVGRSASPADRLDAAGDDDRDGSPSFSEFGLGAPPVRRSGRPDRAGHRVRLPFPLPASLAQLDRRMLVGVGLVVVAVVGVVGWRSVSRPASLEDSMPIASDEPAPAAATATSSPGGASAAPASVTAPVAAGTAGAAASGTATDGTSAGAGGTAPVFVHVAGAVASPGVVQLPGGSRVVDAVAAAGGLRADADSDRVNLAAPLVDGSRIVVPVIGQEAPSEVAVVGAAPDAGAGSPAGTSGAPTAATPVNLNTATIEQLDELPGVGPATAQAIVSFRESDGRFTSVDALLDVRGIGDAKLEALRDLVTVG